jgi:hypothetical protein
MTSLFYVLSRRATIKHPLRRTLVRHVILFTNTTVFEIAVIAVKCIIPLRIPLLLFFSAVNLTATFSPSLNQAKSLITFYER